MVDAAKVFLCDPLLLLIVEHHLHNVMSTVNFL